MTDVQDAVDRRATLQSLTKQHKAVAKKSCGATIALAETIVRADEELKDYVLAAFYKGIDVDPDGSTVRKFTILARPQARFKDWAASEEIPGTRVVRCGMGHWYLVRGPGDGR